MGIGSRVSDINALLRFFLRSFGEEKKTSNICVKGKSPSTGGILVRKNEDSTLFLEIKTASSRAGLSAAGDHNDAPSNKLFAEEKK